MDRTATIELTNLCLICQGDKILVQERTWNGEKGLIFPGGHVEMDESILASVIREMKEETGLTIEHPIPCGFKGWVNEDGSRYLVLMFKTDRFTGELRSSEEGRVFWMTREEFLASHVIWYMRDALKVMDSDEYSEIFWPLGSEENLILG